MARSRRPHCIVTCLACLVAIASCRDRQPRARPAPASARGAEPTARLDLSAWLRMRPSEFGCWMERSFGHRDASWNCSTPERPAVSDPCEEGFDDGPEVPADVARRIHPLLREVEVAWERGALQSATFRFDPSVSEPQMAGLLGVDQRTLDSAASAGPGSCDTPCYELVVFAPSDVDCDEEDEGEQR